MPRTTMPDFEKKPDALIQLKASIPITKMQATGNDFILINNIKEKLPFHSFPDLARSLCRRRESIGADGLILLGSSSSTQAAFRMHFYNQDGSPGEMCGNGARCAARFAFDEKLAWESMTFETLSGPVEARRLTMRLWQIRLPSPCVCRAVNHLSWKDRRFCGYYMELGHPGLPHFCVELPGFHTWPQDQLKELAVFFRHHPFFPKGTNVNFFFVDEKHRLIEKTFERGVEDFTLSCGTGSGCSALCAILQGKIAGPEVEVLVPGGVLHVHCPSSGDPLASQLFLAGETVKVLEGLFFSEAMEV